MKIEKFIKNQQWLQILTRDIPFLRLVIVYESYSQRFKKDIGLDYPSGISVLRNGIFNIYRSKKQMIDFGNDFLALKNKIQFFEKILEKMRIRKKEAKKAIDFCKKKLKSKKELSLKELLKIFKMAYLSMKNFWSLQWSPMALEFSLNIINKGDLLQKYKKYFVGIREESQYITIYLEDLIDTILRKIARNKKIEGILIFFATPAEIIQNKISEKTLINRRKMSVLGATKNKCFIFSGKKAQKLAKYIVSLEEKTKIDLIKGNPAYPGVVKGNVRVIFFRKDLKNFKKGEILVTPMTEAFYTSYLEKVKAIITDEGGITCHAAIISRELEKPCIIGTKIATKVLRDGQIVEVDANKGVVKIISKK